jgi:hypothetical protein
MPTVAPANIYGDGAVEGARPASLAGAWMEHALLQYGFALVSLLTSYLVC